MGVHSDIDKPARCPNDRHPRNAAKPMMVMSCLAPTAFDPATLTLLLISNILTLVHCIDEAINLPFSANLFFDIHNHLKISKLRTEKKNSPSFRH